MPDAPPDGFHVRFRPVSPEHVAAHVGRALWYYERRPFPTPQPVFPSTAGA
jgi:hypothetical protein